MNKSTTKNAPNPTSSGSGEGKHDLIDRQAAIEAMGKAKWAKERLMELPSAQPELIAQDAYVRGFEQGRTQGMVDSQGGKKQRKVLITTTYNEMGIIIDTKAEEVGQPDRVADISKKVSISCGRENDLISRQMAIDTIMGQPPEPHYPSWYAAQIEKLPAAQPEQRWIPVSERLPDEGQKCLVSDKGAIGIDTYIGHGNPFNWELFVRDYEAWMPIPKLTGGDVE